MANSKYTLLCPVNYGCGAINHLPELLQEINVSAPFIVTDQELVKTGIPDRVSSILKKAGCSALLFDGMKMDAPDYCCTQAAEQAKAFGADVIIGLGGGSCLDGAKAISVLCTNQEQNITELITGTPFRNKPLPAVMIPTTSGTGSESTIFAVVSNSENGRKQSLFTAAVQAVLDPELTVGLPAEITAYTGMDALAHAVEAYTSVRPNPFADLLSLDAIQRIMTWLPVACKEPENMTARENMMLASNFAGIAFNSSATHIGHAMAHAMGAVLHIPHGIACAWDVPEVLYLMAEYLPERAHSIGQAMGLALPEEHFGKQLGEELRGRIHQLMREINIPSCGDLKITEEMLRSCREYAVTEKLRGLCGAPVTDDEIAQALINCARNYQ